MQYEYTPKYNPTLGIAPTTATPNPAYNSRNPFGREVMILDASTNVRPLPLWIACCCIVLIVSNGAKSAFEQPAANADAIEFLIPLMVALLDDFPPLVFIGLVEMCDEGMDTEAAWILVRVATINQMERMLILPMFAIGTKLKKLKTRAIYLLYLVEL